MDKFLQHHLRLAVKAVITIENGLRELKDNLLVLCGYADDGFSQSDYPPIPTPQLNQESNGFGNQKSLVEVIKEMIIELKIKGSVRERANGLIEFRTQALGSIYGRSREEIETKLTQKLKEVKQGKKKDQPPVNKNKTPLLSEFFTAEYLPYKKNQGRSESSIKSYHSLFGYISRANFDKPLAAYKSKEIEDFFYSVPHSRTRQILQGFLNNMFKRAIVLGYVKFNPCSAIEKCQHTQEQGEAFSFDEQREFFCNLGETDKLTYMEKCFYLFVYLTGTRKQEALSVGREDVDFTNKVLSIRGTKTEGSNRKMPLTPLVERLLKSIDIKHGKYFDLNRYGADKAFRKVWSKAKGHKLHDLRHTYGTIQVSVEKVDVKTVSLVMGHSTVDTTLNRYTHPEQLDRGTFLRGDLTPEEKLATYKSNYREISCQIEAIIR